jgi:nucleotide-binding universal stress UspA family protein
MARIAGPETRTNVAKVLIAVDGSELATEAAVRALAILGRPREILVLEVVHLPLSLAVGPPGSADDGLPSPDQVLATSEVGEVDARAHVADVARRLDGEVCQLVEEGDPGDVICQMAAAEAVDLIVVGSHGKGWARRAILGSVSQHVLAHALCPVLVVQHGR